MAFGFFRNNQKFVLIIMAVLMVTFGLSSVITSQSDCNRRGGDYVIGKANGDKITRLDSEVSNRELVVLKSLQMESIEPAFATLMANDNDAALAFTLLQREAEEAGIRVTEGEVTEYEESIARALGDKNVAGLYKRARAETNADEKTVNKAVSDWLMIVKNLGVHRLSTPPSETELRRFYRDCNEQIKLRTLTLKASDYLPAAMPSEKDILDLFNLCKANYRGLCTEENPFGFGYIQLPRVKVQYLLIKQDVVDRVVRPSDDEVLKAFYVSYKDKGEKLEQVREKIVTELMPKAVVDRMDSVLEHADKAAAASKTGSANSYDAAVAGMTGSADKFLQIPLSNLHLSGPLQDVIGQLAQEAKVTICYPWGTRGLDEEPTVFIDPKVSVSVDAQKITLGEALQKITDQVMGPSATTASATMPAQTPQLKWATCSGFERTIFPLGNGELDMFPIEAQETVPLDAGGLSRDMILGRAATGQGPQSQSLASLAFSAKPLIEGDAKETAGALNVGEQGPRMFVLTASGYDRLTWRLSQATPKSEPTVDTLKSDIALRMQVTSDWKTMQGLKAAQNVAAQIEKLAAKDGLESAAKSRKLTTTETEYFPRQLVYSPREMEKRRLAFQGVNYMDAMAATLHFPGIAVEPMPVPGLGFEQLMGRRPVTPYVVTTIKDVTAKAFTLAPADVEPPYAKDLRVAVVPVKALHSVVLMQRSGFKPAVISEFDKAKAMYARSLLEIQDWEIQRDWFNYAAICKRTGFVPENPSDQ